LIEVSIISRTVTELHVKHGNSGKRTAGIDAEL
jgi:hypothetical protein